VRSLREEKQPPQFGKYRLVRRLAVGGMAELFLAKALSLHSFEKLVVVKRILPQFADNEDFIDMFLDEARLAAQLRHPNIVQVYDIGEDQGSQFFTMEYIHGQDLRRLGRNLSKQGRTLPLEHVLSIIIGTAAGLHHAHKSADMSGHPMNIVHRDVSPANILVTYEGGVKLVDFGIAKARTAQVTTAAGTLKGKIPYMSPEQCRGEALDSRSDLFSLGTLLWEFTVGQRLFRGDSEFATLHKISNEEAPAPRSIVPDYPEELERIVLKALQRDREKRYQTGQELQIDLEDFARDQRLAVSSARLSAFMTELFTDEAAANPLTVPENERGRPLEPGTTELTVGDVDVLSTEMIARGVNKTAEYSMEDAPLPDMEDAPTSAVIKSSPTITPGNAAPAAPGASELDDLDFGGQPDLKKWAVAVGAAVILAVGAAMAFGGEESPPEAPAETEVPTAVVAPPVLPEPKPEPEPEPEPVVEPAEEPAAAAASPAKKPKTRRTRPKRSKKKPKKSTTKSPGWDPDSALPPS
jgi:serine/threonine-protein kinase